MGWGTEGPGLFPSPSRGAVRAHVAALCTLSVTVWPCIVSAQTVHLQREPSLGVEGRVRIQAGAPRSV